VSTVDRLRLAAAMVLVTAGPVSAIPEHDAIQQYSGPATCLACHRTQAEAMFGAVHYQWTGPTPDVTNIDGSAGKRELGVNSYCGSPSSSRRRPAPPATRATEGAHRNDEQRPTREYRLPAVPSGCLSAQSGRSVRAGDRHRLPGNAADREHAGRKRGWRFPVSAGRGENVDQRP